MTDKTPLTLLPKALLDAGYEPIGYRACYEAARSAKIPADFGSNGRWTFDLSDIDQIANCLLLSRTA